MVESYLIAFRWSAYPILWVSRGWYRRRKQTSAGWKVQLSLL